MKGFEGVLKGFEGVFGRMSGALGDAANRVSNPTADQRAKQAAEQAQANEYLAANPPASAGAISSALKNLKVPPSAWEGGPSGRIETADMPAAEVVAEPTAKSTAANRIAKAFQNAPMTDAAKSLGTIANQKSAAGKMYEAISRAAPAMAKGGKVKKAEVKNYAEGGLVRGYGKARGAKQCKIY